MATYIKPDAVKDGSLSKSKLDTALTNEINGKLTDAPKDGKVYGRKDGAWSEVQGGGMRKIADITTTEGVSSLEINKDNDGNPLTLRQISVRLHTPPKASNLGGSWYFYLLQQNGSPTTSFHIAIIEGSQSIDVALDAHCDGMFANNIVFQPNYSVATIKMTLSNDNPFTVFKATNFEGKMLPMGTRVVIYGK